MCPVFGPPSTYWNIVFALRGSLVSSYFHPSSLEYLDRSSLRSIQDHFSSWSFHLISPTMPAKSPTINPSFSQPSSSFSPASPAPSSSYTHDDDDHDDNHESGPARKRARTSGSAKDSSATSVSEQRKEARAHRNRIAAQNSRDRRKAQFAYLERRVAELEEENRRLRAGMPVNPAPVSVPSIPLHAAPTFDPSSIPLPLRLPTAAEDHLRAEREKERERENEELKERIKTLERGWDAVVKALAAQGVAAGIFNVAPSQSSPSASAPAPSAPAPVVSTQPSFTAFPSPAPSHSSLEYDLSSATTSSPATSPSVPAQSLSLSQASAPTPSLSEPTRHLARVATTGGPSLVRSPVSLQRVDSVTASVQVQLVQAVSPSTLVPPYIRALQLKTQHMGTRSMTGPWRPCSVRSSRRRARNPRPCLLKVRLAAAPPRRK